MTAKTAPVATRKGVFVSAGLIHPLEEVRQQAASHLPAVLAGVDRGVLFELAWMLGCLEDEDCMRALRQPCKVPAERRLAILSRGGILLINWPDCVGEMLEETVLRCGRKRAIVIRDCIITIRRTVFAVPRSAELLWEAFLRCPFGAHEKGQLEEIGLVTSERLARTSKLDPRILRRLRHKNAIKYYVVGEGSRSRVVFPANAAREIRESLDTRISAFEFSSQIGISVDGVHDLVGEGLVAPATDPITRSLYDELHLDPAAAKCIALQLEAAAVRDPIPNGSERLGLVLRAYGRAEKPWPAIVRAVLAGDIQLYSQSTNGIDLRFCWVPPSFNQAVLGLAAPDTALDHHTRPKWLPERDVWELLNCGSRQVRALIRAFLLTPSGTYTGSTFNRHHVLKISSCAVHPTELRARMRLHAQSRVSDALIATGLRPNCAGFFDRQAASKFYGLR